MKTNPQRAGVVLELEKLSIAEAILDEKDIVLRKCYLGLTPEVETCLKELQPLVREHLDELVDAFYNHLLAFEETKRVLKDEATVKRLKEAQRHYLDSLFSGDYGPQYIISRLKIGEIHYRLGLGTRWYLGAMNLYRGLLTRLLRESCKDADTCFSAIEALNKILSFDTQLVIEMYELIYNLALRDSEEIFRNITASAKDAIIMVDNGGGISFWNEAAERMFGYSREESVGKNLHELIVPERFREDYLRGFDGFRDTGQGPVIGKTLELVGIKRDGAEFPVELSISAVELKGKWNAIGIVRDITGRKSVEESLKQSLETLQIDRQVYENLPNCIVITDMEQKITRVNPLACEKLTGYTAEELIGKTPAVFKSDVTPKYVYSEMEESLVTKGFWQGEVVNKKKDGTDWDCHLTILTLKDTAGVPTGYMGIMRDITEEKRHRESVEQHARAMEAMQERYRKAHESAIYMLALACEAKDEDTGSHVLRIRGYTTAVARELGLPDAHAEEIGISSILHDVDKLHIPDAILMKPGPLTPEEREVMNTHPLHSDRILPKEYFEIARNIARCHHENWDGTGYPNGLKGADIPVEARITRVADVFDALTSKRPYKEVWGEEEALEKILSMKGRELCPKTVEAFEAAFKKSAILEIKRKYA